MRQRVGLPWDGDSQSKESGEAHDDRDVDSEDQMRPKAGQTPGYGTAKMTRPTTAECETEVVLLAV